MKRALVACIGLVLFAVGARPASAAPVLGQQLFATGGDVTATFLGHTAGFTNDLYLFDAGDLSTPLAVTATVGPLGPGLIFTNQTSAPGSSVNLGSFAAGTELVFAIYVRNTQQTYFMGPGSRNPDGIFHAAVDNGLAPQFPSYGTVPPGSIAIGFEDLFGGGDLDYDDLGFAFSSVRRTATPEPATLSLLALGLAAGGIRRLRQGRRG
jgi:hypothetical protein